MFTAYAYTEASASDPPQQYPQFMKLTYIVEYSKLSR